MNLSAKKIKLSTQADPRLLETLRGMAQAEGRQLQALIDEALREYVEKKKEANRGHALRALADSLLQSDDLYRELAK
jgi:hypothetical protein